MEDLDLLNDDSSMSADDFDRMMEELPDTEGEVTEFDLDDDAEDAENAEAGEGAPAQPVASNPGEGAAPAAAATSVLDAELNDPSLPPTYQGRKVRDIWQERTDLTGQLHRANQVKNDLEAELRATRATLELLAQRTGAASPTGQPQPQQNLTPRQRANIDFEQSFITNEAMDTVLTETVNEAETRLGSKIQQLEGQLTELRQKEELTMMRGAAERARASLEIDEVTWNMRLRDVITDILQTGDNTLLFNPEAYKKAYEVRAEAWGAVKAEPKQSATPEPAAPQQPAARPVAGGKKIPLVSSTPAAGGGSILPRRLDKRMAKMTSTFAKEFGLDPAELEAEVIRDYENGVWR